jgi:hypothetical protein
MIESRQFDVKIIGQMDNVETVEYSGGKETVKF